MHVIVQTKFYNSETEMNDFISLSKIKHQDITK